MKILSAVERLGRRDVTEHFIKYQDVRSGWQLSRHGTLTLRNKDVNLNYQSRIRVWSCRTLLPLVHFITVHCMEVCELHLACIPVDFNCFKGATSRFANLKKFS